MRPADYLDIVRRLLRTGAGRPRQADLRKAVSIAYYAVFYALCQNSADCFIGTSGADRSERAWQQAFRAVEHGFARHQCMNQQLMAHFPQEIQFFGISFTTLQEKRHEADYHPGTEFSLRDAQALLDTATLAIAELGKASLKDRRDFAAWVTLKDRP